MGRKHHRKHDHKKPPEDKPAPVVGAPPENPNARHCEAVHQECQKKEEPTKWWRNPEWGKVIAESAIAFFTFASFIALWIQLKDARDNFIKDQRPYVWVTPDSPVFKDQETIKWNFNYSNYGRSPAFNVRSGGFYAWGVGAWKEIRDLSLADCVKAGKGNIEGTGSVVPPGYPEVTTMQTNTKFREDIDRKILGSDGVLMNENVLEYEDSSGNRYRSLSCVYRLATGAIAHCDKYNYIKPIK